VGFTYVIVPARSVAMTASAMDASVTNACSFSRKRFS